MPKRPHRDKQTVRPGKPATARELITSRLPALAQRALKAPEASEWQVAVMKALGPELANKVNRCSLEHGKLTVVAESASWAARMQFALAEIGPTLTGIAPEFREVVIRVRPRRGDPRR